jgi:hypothetical protein
MAFNTSYTVGGELDKVKKIGMVENIKNFAQLPQPYNKMCAWNIPAVAGVFDLNYTGPDQEVELLSIVVTCSGYGENDYYNIYVDDELWFDTWYPTEVKEGLYIGTSTYVAMLPASTKIRLEFFNVSGTAKKIWLGIRMLREKTPTTQTSGAFENVNKITLPTREITQEDIDNSSNSTA